MIVLAAQTVLVAAWATYVAFKFVGRDYESAIIAGAFCGFAMGATATAIANMQVLTRRHGPAPRWLIDQRTTTIHMPDADRLSVRDHTAIYEAVAARDPMRAFHEMTSHLRLISELYRESKRLSEEILRQIARDVAGRIERERESMWVAGPKARDEQHKPAESAAAKNKANRKTKDA